MVAADYYYPDGECLADSFCNPEVEKLLAMAARD